MSAKLTADRARVLLSAMADAFDAHSAARQEADNSHELACADRDLCRVLPDGDTIRALAELIIPIGYVPPEVYARGRADAFDSGVDVGGRAVAAFDDAWQDGTLPPGDMIGPVRADVDSATCATLAAHGLSFKRAACVVAKVRSND